ncbi:MAG: 3-hydroxyacyl-ACP dehydratase FabZ [Bacteroidales bacterium]|jgi:UDP-3-O-[3-hydroxymyristoyl] N-acetylglucosamine deacetylase/3-hydroxyacyl-[acyl-carrier-protein] dehydratase|nr:3-hydroxyacyl-ACP dehydratase FabZ [Bacteroidales bacterium]
MEIEQIINSYNPEDKPIKDLAQIKQLLPHREPFLFLDKVIYLTETEVVGVREIKTTENFFKGHFPDTPIMPGVLQIEALAQTGGILLLSTVPDPENYLCLFMKIENAKFRTIVVPDAKIFLKLTLLEPIRRGIAHMQGKVYFNNTIAAESEMLAQIKKYKNL